MASVVRFEPMEMATSPLPRALNARVGDFRPIEQLTGKRAGGERRYTEPDRDLAHL